MAIRHQIVDTDTIDSLAYVYLGNENRKEELISYNRLVYPYVSRNREDRYETYAKGFIHATRDDAFNRLVIGKYWTVKSRPSIISTVIKTYHTIEEVVFEEGQYEAYIPIRSVVSGVQGNSPNNTITTLGQEFKDEAIILRITNPAPIDGGFEGRVLATGDYIYIPTEDELVEDNVAERGFSFDSEYFFYGSDIKLSSEEGIDIENNDIATVGYVDNIEQAVRERLRTEIGDNPHDYAYGTALHLLIGDGTLPKDVIMKRAEIEIHQRLAFEDRVKDPNIIRLEFDKAKGIGYVDVEVTIVQLDTQLTISDIQIGGLANV